MALMPKKHRKKHANALATSKSNNANKVEKLENNERKKGFVQAN